MSDSSLPRRQPPSPLVFSPESVLPAIPTQNTSQGSSHASGSNTVSMPFVRRHVYRRLKAAKQECDKELQRVTNSITAFFEERLRENEHELENEREQREYDRGRERDYEQAEPGRMRESFVLQPSELKSALQFEEINSDGGYEAEPEGGYTRSRHRTVNSCYQLMVLLTFSPSSLDFFKSRIITTTFHTSTSEVPFQHPRYWYFKPC